MPKIYKDAGEVLHGAKKHLSCFNKILKKDYSNESQAYKRSELPKIDFHAELNKGTKTSTLIAISALYTSIPRKKAGKYGWVWDANFARAMQYLQALIKNEPEQDEILDTTKNLNSFLTLYDTTYLAFEIGFPACLHMEKSEVKFNNSKEYWYLKDENGSAMLDEVFDSRVDAVNSLRRHLLELKPEPQKPKKRKAKINVFELNTGEIIIGWLNKQRQPLTLAEGFKSTHEALKYLEDNFDTLEAKLLSLKTLKNYWFDENFSFTRTGECHTHTKDITPDLMIEKIHIRGVQFGNWMTGTDRQLATERAFYAFHDAARVTGLPIQALSLNGDLGLAFGARGNARGSLSPAAHFEPIDFIINLTRNGKKPCIGHEMFHALDAYYGALAQSGKVNHRSIEQYATLYCKTKNHLSSNLNSAFMKLNKEIHKSGVLKRSMLKDLTRSEPYWATTIEMAARCFEKWLFDELNKKGLKNCYLAHFNNTHIDESDYPYPTSSEMSNGISDAFCELFKAIKNAKGIESLS